MDTLVDLVYDNQVDIPIDRRVLNNVERDSFTIISDSQVNYFKLCEDI